MAMPQDDGWINLYKTDVLLRYKSELDPKVHAHTKGGYLEGRIRCLRWNNHMKKVECIAFQISGCSERDNVHVPRDIPCR